MLVFSLTWLLLFFRLSWRFFASTYVKFYFVVYFVSTKVRNRFLFCKKLVADEKDFVLDTVKLEFIVPYIYREYKIYFVLEIV